MKIMSTSRLRVLDLINRFGVIANKQLFKFFDGEITSHAIYKILEFLEDEGFIGKSNIGRVYYSYIKPSAHTVVNQPMYNFNKVNQSELLHDLRVNDYLIDNYLRGLNSERYKSVSFFTEREIIDEYLIEQSDNLTDTNVTRQVDKLKRNLSDAVLVFTKHDDTFVKIAIEYEHTQKSKKMYEDILKRYNNQFMKGELSRVIYIVKGRRIQRKIEQVMNEQNYSFDIRFQNADEVF